MTFTLKSATVTLRSVKDSRDAELTDMLFELGVPHLNFMRIQRAMLCRVALPGRDTERHFGVALCSKDDLYRPTEGVKKALREAMVNIPRTERAVIWREFLAMLNRRNWFAPPKGA